jgi:hypothetical protein
LLIDLLDCIFRFLRIPKDDFSLGKDRIKKSVKPWLNALIEQTHLQARQEIIEKIKKLIIQEILICQKEGHSTANLLSSLMLLFLCS